MNIKSTNKLLSFCGITATTLIFLQCACILALEHYKNELEPKYTPVIEDFFATFVPFEEKEPVTETILLGNLLENSVEIHFYLVEDIEGVGIPQKITEKNTTNFGGDFVKIGEFLEPLILYPINAETFLFPNEYQESSSYMSMSIKEADDIFYTIKFYDNNSFLEFSTNHKDYAEYVYTTDKSNQELMVSLSSFVH